MYCAFPHLSIVHSEINVPCFLCLLCLSLRVTLKVCCLSLWQASPPSISVLTSSRSCWPSPSWKSRWALPSHRLFVLPLNPWLVPESLLHIHFYFFKAALLGSVCSISMWWEMCRCSERIRVHTDLCNPVAVVFVHPVRVAQVSQCGPVGHQCHGHPTHRSVNSSFLSLQLICSCFCCGLFYSSYLCFHLLLCLHHWICSQ